MFCFLGCTIDECHAPRFICADVHIDVTDNGVNDKRAIPSLERIFDSGERAAEVGVRHTSALAGTAVVAGRAAVVGLRDNCGSSNGDSPPECFLHAVPQADLPATHFHWRKKLAIGQHLIVLGSAADSNIVFDDVIKRREIAI